MSDFDSRARGWDNEQRHADRTQAIASEILKSVPVKPGMKALEYGAGTGMLSFMLKESFSEITMMDNSREMVNVTNEKIQAAGVKNMHALFIDLEKEDFKGEFDIIYSQMALHHVAKVDLLLGKFFYHLSKGGSLAIADLYREDGSFHGEKKVPHDGFDMDELSSMLYKNGFSSVAHRQCYVLKKAIASGEVREFPIFLMTASK